MKDWSHKCVKVSTTGVSTGLGIGEPGYFWRVDAPTKLTDDVNARAVKAWAGIFNGPFLTSVPH